MSKTVAVKRCKVRLNQVHMPYKQTPSLQAIAFAALLKCDGFAVAQSIFERRLFKNLCLKWANMYSNSVLTPYHITSTIFPNETDYLSLRTFKNYVPDNEFVDGQGCINATHECLKYVGMLRMEHIRKLDHDIVLKHWDVIYVQCFVTKIDYRFYNMLMKTYKRNNTCNLNKLLYKFYSTTCDI
ncbi:hypothetical protein [Epiphyas postvittana nucleopolyhedrovirus]|uniref:Uncharacterized protein n=1 Tax=Epiphyas postvittana nucleopolyhedrovirus TaxID=70600 RepID=Q91GM1_NPVEP|nr:hypothetical protein [Epiphyas postvittana nucleopolyhedrovirus]AAK85593.1 unknown [Epiphyas postvittana nucleopolyhedrovirus]